MRTRGRGGGVNWEVSSKGCIFSYAQRWSTGSFHIDLASNLSQDSGVPSTLPTHGSSQGFDLDLAPPRCTSQPAINLTLIWAKISRGIPVPSWVNPSAIQSMWDSHLKREWKGCLREWSSDLRTVGFAGGRKLTPVFRSLHSRLYLCPLIYDLQELTSPDSCRPTNPHLRSTTLPDLPN
jgi:hypothetical protein